MATTEKRKPKSEINYKIQLNEEQKLVKQGVFEKDVTIVLGKAASGKTQVATLTALDMLFKRHVERIIISRPVVRDSLGFIPGSVENKMEGRVAPIKQCLYQAYDPVKIDKLIEEKVIQILPIDYMKGVTFSNAVVIIDEFEDLSYEDYILTLTRLGKDSKLIYTGSAEQIDRTVKSSCIPKVLLLKDSPLVNFHVLESNHRNPVIFEIIKTMEDGTQSS